MKQKSAPGKKPTAAKRQKSSGLPAVAANKAIAKTKTARKTVPSVGAQTRHEMIAQAAYFRAERRGFVGGGEVEDWLEAEREIERTLKG
ncbi:MAG: DUF2934 domain-containing protein [Gammaproteobacteria bacterium]